MRLNYYGKDYNTILNELKEYISKNHSEYTNIFESDMGIMLLEVIAYGLDTMSFYLDRNVSEAYLETAKSLKSVERIVRQLGYKITPAMSSVSNVYIQFNQKYNFPIVFYKGYIFTGGGLEFVVDKDTEILVNTDDKLSKTYTIPVREGRDYVEYFVSRGSKNQTFTLTGVPDKKFLSGYIENTTSEIEVYINNVKWQYKDLIEYKDTNCFEIEYSKPPILRFGGFSGQIPPVGSEIRIKYHICSGKSGNLLKNQIVGKTPLIVNNNNIQFDIVGSDTCSGGSDVEDIEQIRTNAPYYYKSKGLAITQVDFDYIIRNQIGVAKGKAISNRDMKDTIPFYSNLVETNRIVTMIENFVYNLSISDSDKKQIYNLLSEIRYNVSMVDNNLSELISVDTKANVVEIYILSKDASGKFTSPSAYLVDTIRNKFEDIVEPTIDVIVLDGMTNSYVVDIKVNLEVLQGYDAIYVSNNVRQAITDIFNNLEFGQNLYLGDIYQRIESIDGVEHSNIFISNVWYNAKLDTNYRYKFNNKIVNDNVIVNKNEFLILGELIVNLV